MNINGALSTLRDAHASPVSRERCMRYLLKDYYTVQYTKHGWLQGQVIRVDLGEDLNPEVLILPILEAVEATIREALAKRWFTRIKPYLPGFWNNRITTFREEHLLGDLHW